MGITTKCFNGIGAENCTFVVSLAADRHVLTDRLGERNDNDFNTTTYNEACGREREGEGAGLEAQSIDRNCD